MKKSNIKSHVAMYKSVLLFALIFILNTPVWSQISPDSLLVLKVQAKSGVPASIFQLGVIYEEGRYERQNIKKAIDYYTEASNLQYDSARFALGKLYELGKGVDQNFVKALEYYNSSIQKKPHAEAMYRLGTLYEKGLGVEKADLKIATEHYLDAWRFGYLPAQVKLDAVNVDSLSSQKNVSYIYYKASKGDAKNQYYAGRLLEEGLGLPKDLKKAFDYYQKSKAQGFVKADIALGDMYANGILVQRNARIAVNHYLAAANKGDQEAMDKLKALDIEKELDPNSLEYLSYKAMTGEAPKQYQLYLKYFNGDGVPANYELALEYCQKSASDGYEKAMLALANMYQRGIIVNMDPKTAFYWYRKAALLGNDQSRFMLAEMYASGQGVDKDEARAVRYYLSAANSGIEPAMQRLSQYDLAKYVATNDLEYIKYTATKGDINAQLSVGKYYFNQDNGQSIRWLQQAAEQGDSEAQVMLGEIYFKGKCNMPIDNDEALKWFSLAAGKKNPVAFRYLADMYVQNLIPTSNDNLETAFQMANEYLSIKNGQLGKDDAHLYKIMGDIYTKRDDYANAVIYYTRYINMYEEELNKPMDLISALETRAKAYYMLQQYGSAATDYDIALIKLEESKEHEDVKYEYEYIRGYLLVEKTRAYLGMQHYFKACNTLQEAIKLGAKVPQEFIDTCMKN